MTTMPGIFDEGRGNKVALISLCCICQGAGLMLSAFATRDVFIALHTGNGPAALSLLGLALAAIILAACQVQGGIWAEEVGQSYARSLRLRLYRHIAGMSNFDLARRRLGALSLRFVGDLSAARSWAGLGLARVASALVLLPTAVLTLYALNPYLAIAGSLPVAIGLVLSSLIAIALPNSHRLLRSRRAGIAVKLMERIAIATRLDLLGRTQREVQNLRKSSFAVADDAIARTRRLAIVQALPQLGASLGGIAIFLTTALVEFPASDAAAALAVLAIALLPIRDLAGVWDRYCAWRIAKAKIAELLSAQSTNRRFKTRSHAVTVKFDGVSVAGVYANLELPAGCLVHIVGSAGSGKSSLLAVAAAQARPSSGCVFYGDTTDVPKIAYIGETFSILKGSLRRSLTMACRKRPKDEKILETAQDYGLAQLISRVGGLNGRIEELGRSVSSGEALRIELVRAVLSGPDLIIIDNSSLIADMEANILVEMIYSTCHATILVAGGRIHDLPSARTLRIENGILRPVYTTPKDDHVTSGVDLATSQLHGYSQSIHRRGLNPEGTNSTRPKLLPEPPRTIRLVSPSSGHIGRGAGNTE